MPEAYAVAEPVKYATAPSAQVVQVVAPATLSAGYTFLATVNGQSISITVPEGGVKEGQVFTVPLPTVSAPVAGEATPLTASATTAYLDTSPRGVWKDGLFDCCTLGPCHPSLLNAWFVPQILMAQVLTRMNMNWLGQTNRSDDAPKTFRKVVTVFIAYWIMTSILAPPVSDVEVVGDDMHPQVEVIPPDVPFLQSFLYQLVNSAFGLYSIIVLMNLRRAVRERYAIPSQTACDGQLEDFCCSLVCGCCTVSQLARHTADYHERAALCCSPTGLPPGPPTVMVV